MKKFVHFLKYFFKYMIQIIIGTGAIVLGVYLMISAPGFILPFTGIIPLSTVFIMGFWWSNHGKWM